MAFSRNTSLMPAILLVTVMMLVFPGSILAETTYRVAYLEAGPYWTYTETFEAIKREVAKKELWASLGWNGSVEYPKDVYFSPGWEEEKKAELAQRANELMVRDDIHLIIAAGTAATAALLEANTGKTPILAMAVADAVKSKFVKNEMDSGVDNFTVRIVPGRYKRMFEIFHDVVGFNNLGLMYTDTENGRRYANVEDARSVAKERGFNLIEYKKISRAETNEDCVKGISWLIEQGMDAFFIPPLSCFEWEKSDVKSLLDQLMGNKVPSFAREGTSMVRSGALMGFSTYDFSGRGRFLAERMVKILLGTPPRELKMVDNATPKISLNISVAEKIGFDPSFDILGASDEIFQDIELPENRLVK